MIRENAFFILLYADDIILFAKDNQSMIKKIYN